MRASLEPPVLFTATAAFPGAPVRATLTLHDVSEQQHNMTVESGDSCGSHTPEWFLQQPRFVQLLQAWHCRPHLRLMELGAQFFRDYSFT